MDYTVPTRRMLVGRQKQTDNRKNKEAFAERCRYLETHRVSIKIDPVTREGAATIVERETHE